MQLQLTAPRAGEGDKRRARRCLDSYNAQTALLDATVNT